MRPYTLTLTKRETLPLKVPDALDAMRFFLLIMVKLSWLGFDNGQDGKNKTATMNIIPKCSVGTFETLH